MAPNEPSGSLAAATIAPGRSAQAVSGALTRALADYRETRQKATETVMPERARKEIERFRGQLLVINPQTIPDPVLRGTTLAAINGVIASLERPYVAGRTGAETAAGALSNAPEIVDAMGTTARAVRTALRGLLGDEFAHLALAGVKVVLSVPLEAAAGYAAKLSQGRGESLLDTIAAVDDAPNVPA